MIIHLNGLKGGVIDLESVLIIGENNDFTAQLINKFHREKWLVYLLTSQKPSKKMDAVFKYYIFEYYNENIKEIISGSRPDLIVFMGAFDNSFAWKENCDKAARDYISGLNNILNHVGLFGVSNFIYLSSESVFEDQYVLDIQEDFIPHPKSIRNLALLQGESMVRNIKIITGLETITVRIDGMYGMPTIDSKCDSKFMDMCINAVSQKQISVNDKKKFSAIFVKDAVEGLYRLISAPRRRYDLYHISSMEEISELDVALIIKESCPYSVQIIDETVGLDQRKILSNERFKSEFLLDVRNDYRKVLPQIMEFVNSSRSLFMEDRDAHFSLKENIKRIFKVLAPFIEATVVFVVIFYLSIKKTEYPFLSGFNLYILYSLTFALLYGRKQAIYTSFLGALGQIYYRFFLVSGLSQEHLYIELVQMFLITLPVGHLKDVYYEMKKEKNKDIRLLDDKLKDLSIINDINTDIKNYYADMVIGSKEGIGKIYSITSKLQNALLGEVQFAAIDVLLEIFATQNVSIYFVSNNEYCRLASSSSELASSLGKTIKISENREMFDTLQSKNVYIDKSFKSTAPSMASAIFDENGNIRTLILVWGLPYDKMNLDSANLLSIARTLFHSYFEREADILEIISYERYIENTKILKKDAFDQMLDLHRRASVKGYGQFSLAYVKQTGNIENESNRLHELIRATDFIGQTEEKDYILLLTNTNQSELSYVKRRLLENNFEILK